MGGKGGGGFWGIGTAALCFFITTTLSSLDLLIPSLFLVALCTGSLLAADGPTSSRYILTLSEVDRPLVVLSLLTGVLVLGTSDAGISCLEQVLGTRLLTESCFELCLAGATSEEEVETDEGGESRE